MFYYVMQTHKGVTHPHGPYKTREGRDHAMERIHGGEIFPFDSIEEDPVKAVDDYKAEGLRSKG